MNCQYSLFLQKSFTMARIFLVPSLLSDSDWQQVLPARVFQILSETRFYVVENIRTTRRFIKMVNKQIDINTLTFFELNEHTGIEEISDMLKPVEQGFDMAVVSEAGCSGVADPGSAIVGLAYKKGFKVIPVSGPSSVILALMASGLNGQNFAFNGYLPIKPYERTHTLTNLEKRALNERQTQIFIETPYRNNQMLADILRTLSPSMLLCIAANITGENEFIVTKSVREWKNKMPDLNKQPAIFLFGS